MIFHLIIVVAGYLSPSHSLELYFGECPLYYESACDPDLIKFLLSAVIDGETRLFRLSPFKPELPANFNPFVPTKVVIHGYGGLSVDSATTNVTKAYRDVGYNVIVVDWGLLGAVPCYPTAYLNTWHVGQCVAILLVSLMPLGIRPDLLHLVGFSLGAHIAGFAGTHLTRLLGVRVQRITGLDPALPFFATLNNDWKLDPSDGAFVDVIHTSAGSFGKIEALGHADFYVNGGTLQPVCRHMQYPPLCSHIMAGLYFAESIRGNGTFIGKECPSMVNYYLGLCSNGKIAIMGEHANSRNRGIFFVDTSNTSSYTPT